MHQFAAQLFQSVARQAMSDQPFISSRSTMALAVPEEPIASSQPVSRNVDDGLQLAPRRQFGFPKGTLVDPPSGKKRRLKLTQPM
jgi:hypothetical protein